MTIIKWLLILLVLGGGVFYWYTNGTFRLSTDTSQTATTTPTGTATTTAPTAATQTGLTTAPDDVSDKALSSDMMRLDAELSSTQSDSEAVSESMSDTPIEQSY